MTEQYVVTPLSQIINDYGDESTKKLLCQFNPYVDDSVSDFLMKKAIPMERRDLSRTFVAISVDRRVMGFVTIGMKCIRIPKKNMLTGTVLRQCNIEKSTGVAQAFLIGQLARSIDSPKGFGKDMMEYAIGRLREAKEIVGCRMVRLDCSNDLVEYYKENGFKPIRSNDGSNLTQMMIFI